MEFKFDPNQQFQLDAIESMVKVFDGQPQNAEKIVTMLRGQIVLDDAEQASLDIDMSFEVGAVGNNIVLDKSAILENLQTVQDNNGLEVRETLADNALDFDVEMETGTGKTYVYFRTIFELAKTYSFTKFIILVPSVAIKEGVNTSIKLMRQHFRGLNPAVPFDFQFTRESQRKKSKASLPVPTYRSW